MYIDIPPVSPPSEKPWLLTTEIRQSMLVRGIYKIAYYYEEPNDSSFRYRAFNMCEAINLYQDSRCISASFFHQKDYSVFCWLAKTADMLVVCRSGHNDCLYELVRLFKAQGKTVIFDIDDLIIDTSYCKSVSLALAQNYSDSNVANYWHSYFSRMRAAALLCDVVSTTNQYLSGIASKSLGMHSITIPNSLNLGQIAVSKSIFKTKMTTKFARDSRFTFGYFSGSPSHQKDFSILVDPLYRLMEANKDIDLIICGYIEIDKRLSEFADRIIYEPFRDYISLQHLIGRCEASVAPLEYSTFTNCKSELKFFEPAAVGTVCLASPTYTFKAAISSGYNGFICQQHQWFKYMIEAYRNPDEIAAISRNSFATAIEKYSPNATFNKIVSAFSLSTLLAS